MLWLSQPDGDRQQFNSVLLGGWRQIISASIAEMIAMMNKMLCWKIDVKGKVAFVKIVAMLE